MGPGRLQAIGAAVLAAAVLLAPLPVWADPVPLRYVVASLVRLRAEPVEDAKEVARLRIAAPVRVKGRQGTWMRVEALTDGTDGPQPVEGWAHAGFFDDAPPTLEHALANLEEAKSAHLQRMWLERAAALAPSDEAVIGRLIELHAATGNAAAEAAARKGLVAAEKRNRSWDGPLYVVRAGQTAIPRACVEGDPAPDDASKRSLSTPELRARAFAIVDSGKVVSLTTEGGRTERLDHRACRTGPCGAQLAYLLPDAREGALVPSWLVAGHRIVGFQSLKARPTWAGEEALECGPGCEAFMDRNSRTIIQRRVQEGSAQWRLVQRTLTGPRVHPWQTAGAHHAQAVPIARFDERPSELKILWRGPSGRAGCKGEHIAWVTRLGFDDVAGTLRSVEAGRRFYEGLLEE